MVGGSPLDAETLSVQLDVMLRMQSELNSIVFPDWAERRFAWHRAIYVEAAEYLEHLGTWKWWKKGSPDMAQARMELVDIWHFGLAWYLNAEPEGKSSSSLVSRILSDIISAEKTAMPLALDSAEANKQHLSKVDKLVAEAGNGTFSTESFVHILAYNQMSFDLLYRQYVGKNVLNRFRQENGYKSGKYIKTWHGHEDNEQLDCILSKLPSDSSLPERVHAELTSLYRTVT